MDNAYMKVPEGNITVPQIRHLREIAQSMDMALNESEYMAIIAIYKSALERILKFNEELKGDR